MKYLITGDKHGQFDTMLATLSHEPAAANDTAIIILGDAGVNFFLNKTDRKLKQRLQDTGYIFYLVRGNHEQRPELIADTVDVFDIAIHGNVLLEPDYDNIRYLKDGCVYDFNGHSALVLGGAYSVDKGYRLARVGCSEDMDENYVAKRAGWFKREMLTREEMEHIYSYTKGRDYDFVLSHTCPLAWEPTDLFLSGLDQSSVDKTMEQWLDMMKDEIHWKIWLFGHYHDDRLVRPHVEMFFHDIEDMEEIWNRWYSDKPENERIGWWITRDPNYDNP